MRRTERDGKAPGNRLVQWRRLIGLAIGQRVGHVNPRERLVEDDPAVRDRELLRRVDAGARGRRWRTAEGGAEHLLLDGQSTLRGLDGRNLRIDLHGLECGGGSGRERVSECPVLAFIQAPAIAWHRSESYPAAACHRPDRGRDERLSRVGGMRTSHRTRFLRW